MPPDLLDLIEAARSVRQSHPLRRDFSFGSVGAAIRSRSGPVYSGVCLDLACGLRFCPEHAAVAEMLKGHETEVDAVVGVGEKGILAPCGRCRELLAQLDTRNLDSRVVLGGDRVVLLRDLLPDHWMEGDVK